MSAKVKRYGKIFIAIIILLAFFITAGLIITGSTAQVPERTTESFVSSPANDSTSASLVDDGKFEPEGTSLVAPITDAQEKPAEDGKVISRNVSEILDKRDSNHRHWEVVKEIEVVDPVTKKVTVEEEISNIIEVGGGICYQDEQKNWQITEAAWKETDDGFVMDTAGYKLEIGKTINDWLHYVVADSDIFLRPAGIIASDGTNEQAIAKLDLTVEGKIDPQDSSRLVFAGAYGPDIDLELQVQAGGYHQNIIFNAPPAIPAHFDSEKTEISVQTELTLEDFMKNQGMGIITPEEEVTELKQGFESKKTKGNIEFVKLIEENGELYGEDRFMFGKSEIFDNKPKSSRTKAVAEKALISNVQGGSYLTEALSNDYFKKAEYPVIWDYTISTIDSSISQDEKWNAATTYHIIDSVSLRNTLIIEPGTVVKFSDYSGFDVASGGSLVAKGRPGEYIIFTSENDNTVGETVNGSSGTPSAEDWDLLSNGDVEMEFCKIAYGDLSAYQGGDISISHCNFYCAEFDAAPWMSGKIQIFNNLMVNRGISVCIYDNGDIDSLAIYNNTVVGCSNYGIYVCYDTTPEVAVAYVSNNLVVNCPIGIWGAHYTNPEELVVSHNAFYGCTTKYSGELSLGDDDVSLSNNPFDTTMTSLGSYFLNETTGGGADLVDTGAGDVSDYFEDPCQWMVRHVPNDSGLGDSRHYFSSTYTTIYSDVVWSPNYETCDTGLIDIGYHHPRIDYYVPNYLMFSSSSSFLKIKPGTVVALGDGIDGSALTINDKFKCQGTPSEYVQFIYSPFLTAGYNALDTTTVNTYQPEMSIGGSELASVSFTRFLKLDKITWCGYDENLDFHDNIIRRCGDCGLYIDDFGSDAEIFNCLFEYTDGSAVIAGMDTSANYCTFGADWEHSFHMWYSGDSSTVTNCYFRASINSIYHDSGCTASNLDEHHNYFFQSSAWGVHRKTYNGTQLDLDDDDIAWYNRDDAADADGTEIYSDWTNFDHRYYWLQAAPSPNTSGLDNASDTPFPYAGYTTDPAHQIDDGAGTNTTAADIGYHYPMNIDADGDGMYLCQEEYAASSDSSIDSDGDGLVDGWGGYINIGDYPAGVDADGDGYVDGESDYGTNPTDEDSNSDSVPDGWDSDGDGMPDGWEVSHGLDPTNDNDGDDDDDGDGITNANEYTLGLNPTVSNEGDSWTVYDYDTAGAVTRMSQQALDSTTWVTLSESHSEYDQAGRVTLSRQLANPGTVNNTDDNIVQTTYNYDSSIDQRWTKAPGVTTIGTSPAAADLLTEYLYDVQGRQTAIIDAAGQTTSYEYDLAGRVTKVTQPGSLETLTEYDDAGRVYTVTNSAGDIQEREYNSRGQVVKQFMLDVDGAVTTAVRQQRWQYDGLGKITREAIMADPTSISDPCETIDRVTDYDRDYSIVNRYEKTYTYSGANIATTVSVLVTASGYNGSGTGKINTSVRYSYNGQPAEADYHIYNASDRPVTRYNKYWDESGTLVKTLTTQMLYDHHGQMTASYLVGTSSNLTTSYEYDGAGRKISETSPGGMETEYAYDGFGRLTAKIEDAGGIARTTGYEYNRLGQLEYQIAYNDSDTQTTTYAYDKLGRETSVTYPDSGVVTYAYNSQGKVNQRVDQNTITTVYEYDELGRLTSKQDAVGSPSIIETYAYDSRGLMTTANKVEGTYPNYTNVASDSFSYNGLGYLTQAQQTIGTASTYTVEYSRDQLGQAASIVYPYTGTPGRTLNYAYTSLGKIDHIQDSASNTLVDYDYSGSLVAQRTYDQITTTATRTYDDFGRLSSYVTANAVSQVVNFGYTYDADSNIVSQQFNHRGAGLENGYSYDSLDRVTGSDYHSSSTFTDETFVYDTLGNRITHSQSGDTVYVPNIANEYTSIGGTAVSYDNAGNLTADHRSGDPSGTAYNYHYDYENRLTAIDTTFTIGENQITIAIAKFAYDALGRRVEKTEEYMSGTTHHYYYDGWRVLRHERDTHNIEYVYGNYLDEVCMQIYAGATDNPFYLVHDHLYSPVAILNQNGDTHESREYSAYGYTGNNTTFCEIAFTGQRQDTFADRDLKLMYYKNRYYDTETGRFLTRDPLGVQDGVDLITFAYTGRPFYPYNFLPLRQYHDSLSMYQFVGSGPVVAIDPMGLATVKIGLNHSITLAAGPGPWPGTAWNVKLSAKTATFFCCNKGNIDLWGNLGGSISGKVIAGFSVNFSDNPLKREPSESTKPELSGNLSECPKEQCSVTIKATGGAEAGLGLGVRGEVGLEIYPNLSKLDWGAEVTPVTGAQLDLTISGGVSCTGPVGKIVEINLPTISPPRKPFRMDSLYGPY